MERKVQRAVKSLQKSTKVNPFSRFSFEDIQSGNSFKAKIFFNSENIPEIEVFQNNGYQMNDLLSRLGTSLNTILNTSLPDARRGSKVYTRRNSNLGDIVALDRETYYYAIDMSIFDCSGRMLGSEFQAKCIETNYTSRCSATSDIANYTVYKLL